MADYVYFSPSVIMLQDELVQHPPAIQFLSDNCKGSASMEEKLASLCTYCDILVDDYFDPNELDALCDMVTSKLYSMRTGIITTH